MAGVTPPIIDAHQHVWDLDRARYDWLGPDAHPIDRTITQEELEPELRAAGVTGTVLVQSADNAEDTDVMFATAAAHPEVVGIVGWVPLGDPDAAAAELERRHASDLFVGVRNLIHDLPDPHWLAGPGPDAGLGVLEDAGVPFDLVAVLPEHLDLIPLISERHPELRIVIDHLAKPPIGLPDSSVWDRQLAVAARNPRVFAKVSGLYAATGDGGSWTVDLVRPFVTRALELFGADRLMYGGDWPISVLSGGYTRVWQGLSQIFDELDPAARTALLGGTARRFYGLSEQRIAAAEAARAD
jgi:L-fuconolactonase